MIVVEWKSNKKDRKSMVIVVDGSFYKQVMRIVFKDEIGSVYRYNNREDMEEGMDDIENRASIRYVFSLIAKKDYSSSALKKKMEEKLISNKAIQYVINRLEKDNYIDDVQWMQRFVEREFYKGNGPLMIEYKAKAKMMVKEGFYEILSQVTEDMQIEKIVELIQKSLKRYRRDKIKLITALKRKGFSYPVINEAIRSLPDQLNEEMV
jgi:SOS response regulatory protein OraA/RecX